MQRLTGNQGVETGRAAAGRIGQEAALLGSKGPATWENALFPTENVDTRAALC
jgi:hypothetical protein